MKKQTNVMLQKTTKELAIFSLKASCLILSAALTIASGIGIALLVVGLI